MKTTDSTEIADRYTRVWQEADPQARTTQIAELWAEEAVHSIEETAYQGRASIEQRIAQAHREFVAGAGFRFETLGAPLSHHDAVLLGWQMLPSGGGEPAAHGYAFLLLDDHGLIRVDYQFTAS